MPNSTSARSKSRLRRAPLLRRSRVALWSRRAWRPRLIFWLGALAVGLTSVAFAKLADAAQHLFGSLTGASTYGTAAMLIVPPAGFAISSYLALRYFPNSQGSGIPQAIAARHLETQAERRWLLSLKVGFGKVMLTLLGLLSGASIGREGPTVQVGAAIMMAVGRAGGAVHERGLILAGSAAGVSAAFNTPLAGIVFAIEEMGRAYQARTNGLVVSAVVVAGLASLALNGNYTYFGESDAVVSSASGWLLVAVCGILGGAFGALFSLAAVRLMRGLRRWTRGDVRRVVGAAAVCGLLVALIGLASGGTTFGTGYEQARTAIEGGTLSPLYFLGKFLAGLASMVSGIPGGIFAPSLAVGAGLGSTIGLVFGGHAALAATLGMTGYFAGVVQAPMTAFVIIIEMTGNQTNVVPVMLTAVLGFGTARIVSGAPLYHSLSRDYVAEALRRRRAEEARAGA